VDGTRTETVARVGTNADIRAKIPVEIIPKLAQAPASPVVMVKRVATTGVAAHAEAVVMVWPASTINVSANPIVNKRIAVTMGVAALAVPATLDLTANLANASWCLRAVET